MNWLDVLLAIMLAVSTIAGLAKGLARSAIGLAALIVALFCGLWFYGVPGSFFYEYLKSRELAHFIGFLIIFVGVIVFGALIGALVARLLKLAQLSWLDRILGLGFGFLRGVLAAAVIVLGIMAFAPKSPPRSVAESRIAPYVVGAADVIVAAAPYEVKEGFRRSYEQLKKLWAETVKKRVRSLPSEKY